MWCWIKTLPLRRRARVVVTLTRCYPKVACYHWHLYRQANNTRDDRSSIISTPPLYNTKGNTVLVPEVHFNSRHMHTSVVSIQWFPLMWWKASGSTLNPLKLYKQITFLFYASSTLNTRILHTWEYFIQAWNVSRSYVFF
jgi:hypothetical protein